MVILSGRKFSRSPAQRWPLGVRPAALQRPIADLLQVAPGMEGTSLLHRWSWKEAAPVPVRLGKPTTVAGQALDLALVADVPDPNLPATSARV